MVKLVYCITKKPGLTDDEFFHYWETVHGALGARIPRLRRLIQSHTVPGASEIRRADFDGMAELWFDSMDDLQAARQSVEWQRSSEDEENFIDLNKVAFFITEEHQIV